MRDLDVVKQFLEAINEHDVDRIGELSSTDCEFIDSLGGSVRGRDALTTAWHDYFGLCPDYWLKAAVVIGGSKCVALFGEAGGTIVEADRLLGANEWRTPAAWRAMVKGNRVAQWQVYADNKPVYDILARLDVAQQFAVTK